MEVAGAQIPRSWFSGKEEEAEEAEREKTMAAGR